jgi:hypothetical protein
VASKNPSTQSSKMSSMNPKEVLKGEFVRRGLKVCASCEPFLSACETMQLHNRLSMFEVYPTSSLDDLLKMFKDFITGDWQVHHPRLSGRASKRRSTCSRSSTKFCWNGNWTIGYDGPPSVGIIQATNHCRSIFISGPHMRY